MNFIAKLFAVIQGLVVVLVTLSAAPALAHGEKAQQPALRMRTVHWFDVDLSTRKLAVNQMLVVKGSFIPSNSWPAHVASIENTAYLNIGVPGPSFVRLDSRINGVPTIRSSSYERGEQYNFEVTLKARTPGRYHLHPIINVKDAGPMIGPGIWVEVVGDQATFENSITTLFNQTLNLETHGFANAAVWSAAWLVLALVWFGYWLTKLPLVLPRYRRATALGENADEMITTRDRQAALVIMVATLMLVAGGFIYASERWPVTTPLQTGKVKTPTLKMAPLPVSVTMDDARYRIPGRSFRIELTVTNSGKAPLNIGEFASGGLRFINSAVLKVTPKDQDDLVAQDALRVEGGPIKPGATQKIVIYADDAMWETQRMTTMIASPDAVVAGMLFFFDAQGNRYPVEISGPMIPLFGG
jgi:methane/ammonia monooxygenase subunit B